MPCEEVVRGWGSDPDTWPGWLHSQLAHPTKGTRLVLAVCRDRGLGSPYAFVGPVKLPVLNWPQEFVSVINAENYREENL
jgi:hypothetical protein